MRLTRRDALVALAAAGVAGGVGSVVQQYDPPRADRASTADGAAIPDADPLPSLVAAADVVYPSEVDGVREFVATYVGGRFDDATHREGVDAAVADLNGVAREWEGEAFASLSTDGRDRLLRELGVDVTDPDPDGTLPARLRYYVVDDLLFALYASPAGGRLVGIENPPGYPGGIESYRRAGTPDEGGGDG